jgi:hypothetical protein
VKGIGLAVVAIVLAAPLGAQAAPDTVFALQRCEVRHPLLGPMRADGIVAAMMTRDGTLDSATVRVLQVENVSVAAFRSAAARLLSTCRYRNASRHREPVPVVITLTFTGSDARLGPAEQVPQLEAGIEPGPVLLPTQLPLASEDGRIEESMLPGSQCTVWRSFSTPRVYGSPADAGRDLNTQLAERSGRVRVEFEVGADGTVPPSSVRVQTSDNPKLLEIFTRQIVRCRFAPARIGGVPVPVRVTMAAATAEIR